MLNSWGLWLLLLWSTMMSGIYLDWQSWYFFLNQLIATSDAHSKFDIKFLKLSKIESMILSSGKLLILLISVYLIHRNKSLMKILKRIGPKIEPCGTHNKVSKICFILLVFCLCLFRWYECRNTIQQYIQDQ